MSDSEPVFEKDTLVIQRVCVPATSYKEKYLPYARYTADYKSPEPYSGFIYYASH
jgi:hypothetical protein